MSMKVRAALSGDIPLLARIVRESHREVAQRFGLTRQNCSRHPAFCTAQWIETDVGRGVRFQILELSGQPLGCVAFERGTGYAAFLNRLSVLPHARNQGVGTRLVRRVKEMAENHSLAQVSVGIIADQLELEQWYLHQGFRSTSRRRFAHLPFDVTYLVYSLYGR